MSAKAPSAVVLNVTEKYIFVQGEVRNPTRGVFEETRNRMGRVIQEGVGVTEFLLATANYFSAKTYLDGWEPAWILGFTNYTQQSIVQSTLLINIFLRTRGV
jgi:hypothetical protein